MSRQVTELDINDVVKEGEAVLMKQFLQVNEYAIIDKTKKGMHLTDERYLFDWKKMCKLSPEAQAFYRKVELGLEKQTKGWLQLDPKDTSKKEKQFIEGFVQDNDKDLVNSRLSERHLFSDGCKNPIMIDSDYSKDID